MAPTVGFRPYRAQVLGNYWPEFKNPPTDRFIADHQSELSQKILDIPIAQREPEVEPDSMSDDVRRKSVATEMGVTQSITCPGSLVANVSTPQASLTPNWRVRILIDNELILRHFRSS